MGFGFDRFIHEWPGRSRGRGLLIRASIGQEPDIEYPRVWIPQIWMSGSFRNLNGKCNALDSRFRRPHLRGTLWRSGGAAA